MSRNETPRTDSFIRLLPPVRLRMEHFRSYESLILVDHEIRELMRKWSEFARSLESELRE